MSSLDRILPFLKPIEDLLLDPAITEVMVNEGGRRIFVERDGAIEGVPDRTLETRNLTVAIKNIARACGDEISDVQPLLDARLEDGSRVAAMFPPCAVAGPVLTIRKFTRRYSLQDLIGVGALTPAIASELTAAVATQQNILISGGTGTGKTTLLNALAAHIPDPGVVATGIAPECRSAIRFEEAVKDVINDYRTNRKRSLDDVERRIEKHLTPFFGARKMTSITTADIREFIDSRQKETTVARKAFTFTARDGTPRHVPEQRRTVAGVSNGEINRELTALKRMFNLAIQSGKLLQKPHIPLLKEDNVRVGFFEREQFLSMLLRLPEQVRPVATFAYVTGWRIDSEVLPLEWRQVDFGAGEIRLDPGKTKNGEGRTFPMTRDLRELLDHQRATTENLQRRLKVVCPRVFHRAGMPIKSFRVAFRTACSEAGCPGRVLHDFRRTAVRNLVRAGIPERVAMQMTGHKTRSVFERYNIVSAGDLREAAKRLDAVTGTISGTIEQNQPARSKA